MPNNHEYLNYAEIQYSEIMRLNELGLIFNNNNITIDTEINNQPAAVFHLGKITILASLNKIGEANNITHYSIGQYPLTSFGLELSNIANASATEDDLLAYGKILKKDSFYDIEIKVDPSSN